MAVSGLVVRGYGAESVLVEVGDPASAVALAAWAREHRLAEEIVPGAETVLLSGVRAPERLRERLRSWRPEPAGRVEGGVVTIQVDYDGPDLAAVAALWGVSERAVVARHTATEFTSAFCGFAPGFAYLTGLPTAWSLPRRESPRTRVPAGSVALADRWCGVYPAASPGGWQLIGRTDTTLWDVDQDPPALLAPGTRVRFRDRR